MTKIQLALVTQGKVIGRMEILQEHMPDMARINHAYEQTGIHTLECPERVRVGDIYINRESGFAKPIPPDDDENPF